jgi:hypothetical protein
VFEAEPLASPSEAEELVARAVVAHHTLDFDTEACVGERSSQEDDGAALLLVGHDLGKGDPGVVVDGNMDELPAGADIAAALPIAGYAMSGSRETPEFLDVDVDQLAGNARARSVGLSWRPLRAFDDGKKVYIEFPLDVMVGVNSLAIVYESVTLSRTVIEHIEFDEQRRAVRAEALHGAPRGILRHVGGRPPLPRGGIDIENAVLYSAASPPTQTRACLRTLVAVSGAKSAGFGDSHISKRRRCTHA